MRGGKCVAWFPHGVDRYVVACASHKNVSFAFRFADWGSVYMRKLAPPLVSYRLFDFVSRLHDDLVISYLVIWRYTSCWYNKYEKQNRKHYACATRSSLPTDRFHTDTSGRFSFTCVIPLRDFVPEWNSCPGTTTKVNSRRSDSPGMTFCAVSCKQI